MDNIKDGFSILGSNIRELMTCFSDALSLSEFNLSDAAHLLLAAMSEDISRGIPWQDSLVHRYRSISENSVIRASEASWRSIAGTGIAADPFRIMMQTKLCRSVMELAMPCLGFSIEPEMLFLEEPEEISEVSRGRVSYFKNVYADEAFERFSGGIKRPRAIYENSFEAACESVYDGESEFAILPLENLSEGRLSYFASIAEKYELTASASCFVASSDGNDRTKFLLLRKNPSVPVGKEKFEAEFIFYPSKDFPLSEFLLAGEYFGLSLIHLDSMIGMERDAAYRGSVLFAADRNSVTEFILYLMIRRAGYSVSGMYRCVGENGDNV